MVRRDPMGYGLTLSGDQPVFVQTVRPGGAAERAGVREGDVILRVDGRRVTEALHTEVVAMIQGGNLSTCCKNRVFFFIEGRRLGGSHRVLPCWKGGGLEGPNGGAVRGGQPAVVGDLPEVWSGKKDGRGHE